MAKKQNWMQSAGESGAEPESEPKLNVLRSDPQFEQQVQRLYRVSVYARWTIVALLWLTIAPLCFWSLRSEFALWHDYFTWTAVRFSLAYNRLPTFGLVLCIGMTVSTLVWQSRNLVWGLPAVERRRLEKQVLRIRRKGRRHPLWKWVCSP